VTSQVEYTLLGVSLAVGLFVSMLVLLELGRRLGLRRLAAGTEGAGVSVIDGAVFALSGLLLAFTFSGAASRFDTRRSPVVEEADAIGTAYLRLDPLPPTRSSRSGRSSAGTSRRAWRRIGRCPMSGQRGRSWPRPQRSRGEIWSQAVAATSGERYQPTRVVVLPAINAMIDITTTRTVAAQAHPPMVIFAMLVLVAMVGSLLAGNAIVTKRVRPWLHVVGIAAATALAVFVILDIEFPRIGLIRLDAFDKVLVDVRESMKQKGTNSDAQSWPESPQLSRSFTYAGSS
jgi:hypothetical protein